MTGRSNTEDAIAALRSHVIDFVSKPFSVRELEQVGATCLAQRAAAPCPRRPWQDGGREDG